MIEPIAMRALNFILNAADAVVVAIKQPAAPAASVIEPVTRDGGLIARD
jgi:hypothetical protein